MFHENTMFRHTRAPRSRAQSSAAVESAVPDAEPAGRGVDADPLPPRLPLGEQNALDTADHGLRLARRDRARAVALDEGVALGAVVALRDRVALGHCFRQRRDEGAAVGVVGRGPLGKHAGCNPRGARPTCRA